MSITVCPIWKHVYHSRWRFVVPIRIPFITICGHCVSTTIRRIGYSKRTFSTRYPNGIDTITYNTYQPPWNPFPYRVVLMVPLCTIIDPFKTICKAQQQLLLHPNHHLYRHVSCTRDVEGIHCRRRCRPQRITTRFVNTWCFMRNCAGTCHTQGWSFNPK